MNDNGLFSRIIEEYGSQEKADEKDEIEVETTKVTATSGAQIKKAQAALMQAEERLTGSVSSSVYYRYFAFAGGIVLLPGLLLLLAAYQGSTSMTSLLLIMNTVSLMFTVANNLFLGFWTSQSIHGFSQGDYMGTYAGLGVGIAIFSFIFSFFMRYVQHRIPASRSTSTELMPFSIITLWAGLRLFRSALSSVLRSPISFFDTTPMGRIMSRLSKDQDTLDTEISMTAFQVCPHRNFHYFKKLTSDVFSSYSI